MEMQPESVCGLLLASFTIQLYTTQSTIVAEAELGVSCARLFSKIRDLSQA